MKIDGNLHTITRTLCADHLGQAFDLLVAGRDATLIQPQNRSNVLVTRCSISSAIHAFAALESQANSLGYDIFSDTSSSRFVPHEQRPFLVQRLAQSWASAPVLDKLFYLACKDGVILISEHLQQKLRELNNLRNWLVHGFAYTTTMLVRPNQDNSFEVLDTEDSVKWSEKFPQTKFSPILEFAPGDAQTALQIVLDALSVLSSVYSQPIAIFTANPRLHWQAIYGGGFDVNTIVEAIPK